MARQARQNKILRDFTHSPNLNPTNDTIANSRRESSTPRPGPFPRAKQDRPPDPGRVTIILSGILTKEKKTNKKKMKQTKSQEPQFVPKNGFLPSGVSVRCHRRVSDRELTALGTHRTLGTLGTPQDAGAQRRNQTDRGKKARKQKKRREILIEGRGLRMRHHVIHFQKSGRRRPSFVWEGRACSLLSCCCLLARGDTRWSDNLMMNRDVYFFSSGETRGIDRDTHTLSGNTPLSSASTSIFFSRSRPWMHSVCTDLTCGLLSCGWGVGVHTTLRQALLARDRSGPCPPTQGARQPEAGMDVGDVG
jgi:hypothetical protein